MLARTNGKRPETETKPEERLTELITTVIKVSKKFKRKIILPLHPRTHKRLVQMNLFKKLEKDEFVDIIEPLGYLDFLNLIVNTDIVMTDSGGIQEKCCICQVPCITLRENTERPVTVEQGTNTIVGNEREIIIEESLRILNEQGKTGKIPELWDGKAADRIIQVLNIKV